MKLPSLEELTERERTLVTLCALGELSLEDSLEWQSLIVTRPDLKYLADEWKSLAGQIAADAVGSAIPSVPDSVVRRLEESRLKYSSSFTVQEKQRRQRIAWFGLSAAAIVTIGFLFLQSRQSGEFRSSELASKDAPVAFPTQALVWLAPGAETSESRPLFIWKFTPGSTYDLVLEDSSGNPKFRSEGVQPPVLFEQMLPVVSASTDLPAGRYRLSIKDAESEILFVKEFLVREGASSSNVGLPPAKLLEQIQFLAQRGDKADALMLLMRLPEDALSAKEFSDWRKKLN